ncbi:hypothetical protein EOM39_07850, partial [Candidatus Gracilibacteria bacterium]|nr:hypothetical protein [Candidatus Gracilibacteria bacterium]
PGAWTSGRAGESGEREFFLIPGKTGEPINHKIETNSTGDGEYHIVLSSFDKDGKTTNSGVTIQGSAKLGFSENYEVVSSASGSKYLDLDDGMPLTLDVTKDFKIEADNIDIRYNVKGKGRENVDRIIYKLVKNEANANNHIDDSGSSPEGQSIKELQSIKGEEKIDGKIEIPLKEPGKYILELNLLDKDGNILKTENVNIEKIKNEKQEMEVKDILNIIFYKNIDLKLYKNSDSEILTNYDYIITSDQLKQNITLTNGNGESTKFSIDKDFKYKSDNNNFEIISHNGTSLLFKETINDLGIEKIYKYNFIQNRIDEFEIIKGKNSQKTNIRYNNNGNISEIKSKDNSLRFIYDNYTGKLTEISDLYENKIIFTYENLKIFDLKLNDELVDINKLDLIRLDYKTIFSLKHKN